MHGAELVLGARSMPDSWRTLALMGLLWLLAEQYAHSSILMALCT